MRVTYVVTLLVVISCLASSDRDYAELSDALGAEEQALAGKSMPTFSKIPFFALRHNAKSAKAKKMADCQSICDHKPNKGKNACRSFSYSVRKAECLWSPHKLSFNGKFVFYSKREKKGPGPKKYRDFPGLMYQAKDWTRYRTETSLDCENMCDKAKDSAGRTCHGYSYKEDDKTCLLSPFGLHYDLDYDYYERDPRAKMVIVKKKKVTKSGKVKKIKIKKKKTPPLDRKMKVKKKDKPVQQTGQYKTQLAVQEGKAKKGKKELASKQKYAKKSIKKKKKAGYNFKILKKEKAKAKKKGKKNEKKAKEMGVKKRKAIQKALREKTKKKFEVLRQKQREADRKKKAEAGVKLRKMQAKMQEKMKKELVYKTKRKEIQIKTEKHAKSNRKKIDGLVRSGTNLAAAERRNKKDGNGAKEDAAKEKVIKINVKRVKGRRHARHQRAYAKFVKKTLQKQLKKRKTDKQVAIAMKGMMKQRKAELAAAIKRHKKMAAIVHLVSLSIAKLKAAANGYQHSINISAKRGKKAPKQEVKLRYTMNNLRATQHKYLFKKKKLAKKGREIAEKKSAVSRLDARMTQKAIGRRRRAGKKKPKNMKKKRKGKKDKKIKAVKSKKLKNNVGVRRRRTKARLTARFKADMKATAGVAALPSILPGLPKGALKKKAKKSVLPSKKKHKARL